MPGLKFITVAIKTIVLVTILGLPATVLALQAGDPLPGLSGTTLEGTEFSVNSLKGRPILLKVGTTWCPTCGQQSQEINRIRAFLTENDIQYIEVFIQENQKKVQNFLGKNNHLHPDIVILDQGKIANALNVYLIPRVILIDENLHIYRDSDPLSSAALQQELQKMLTKK